MNGLQNCLERIFLLLMAAASISTPACIDENSLCDSLALPCSESALGHILANQCRRTCGLCATAKNSEDWGPWKDVTVCSQTCGTGIKKQKRKCQSENGCLGKKKRKIECNTQECLGWSEWAAVTTCSESCGGGTVHQTRSCLDNNECFGESSRTISCNTIPCSELPNNPQWSEWSLWSNCDVSCGLGVQTRARFCQIGFFCSGVALQDQPCQVLEDCPCTCLEDPTCVDDYPNFCASHSNSYICESGLSTASYCRRTCGLCGVCTCGTWSTWITSECSSTCGNGIQTKTRQCPVGKTCDGTSKIILTCNKRACNDSSSEWLSWSNWNSCSATCGSGLRQRTRVCPTSSCVGEYSQQGNCKVADCPAPIGAWSACSRSCDWGTRTKRNCSLCTVEYEDCKVRDCLQETCVSPMLSRYKTRTYSCCNASNSLATSCGISSTNNGRIVGGSTSLRGTWPWMVHIELSSGGLCGGTLVSDNLVLSAAHCFRKKIFSSVLLRFGAETFRDLTVHVQKRIVSSANVYVHLGTDLQDDIAIIKLDQTVSIGGEYVRPICLPQGESVSDDDHCVVAGWGTIGSISQLPSSHLQDAVVRILPFIICQRAYPYDATSAEKMICAGRLSGGVDTCKGDSGGPLFCQRCHSCAWFITGITSFGSKNCGSPGYPGVYTRISSYEKWIDSVAGYNITSGSFSSCN